MESLNFLSEKKLILELKLHLTTVLLDKKECIRNQQYEKAADLREREYTLLKELKQKKDELIQLTNNLDENTLCTEEAFQLTILIQEINLQFTPIKYHKEKVEDYYSNFENEFSRITKLRNELLEENRFREENDL